MTVLRLSGPAAGDTPSLAEAIRADLDARLADVRTAARRVRRGQHGGAAHDLRVATRRLAAGLDLWRDTLEGPARRRALRGLRELRRGVGRLREAAVEVALMDELLGAVPPPVPRGLERERERFVRIERRARARAADRTPARAVRRIERAIARATRGLGLAAPADVLAAARSRLAERRARAIERLGVADCGAEDAALHAARVEAKRWRYEGERLSAVSDARSDAPAQGGESATALRALQQALGRIHDGALLRERLLRHSRARPRRAEALAPVLASLAAERQSTLERLPELARSLRSLPPSAS